jgi:large subunit ribosomal protein L19
LHKKRIRLRAYFIRKGKTTVNELLQALQAPDREHPDVQSGDTVKVHVRIVEGDRERIQIFQGIVIRVRGGGNEKNFTVRRVASHGVGVERTFLLRSPRIEKIEIMRRAKVRRAQLYYLRDLRGKAARLKERR